MTFVLPAANNDHTVEADASDTLWVVNVGTPQATSNAKVAGNLPITANGKQWIGNTAGSTKGVVCEFINGQTGIDVSSDTRVLVWAHQFNAPNRIQVDTLANAGVSLRLYSGTGSPPSAYREYNLGGNDTPLADHVKGPLAFVVDLNDNSEDTEVGTYDNTDVTSYGILTLRANIAGTNSNYQFHPAMFLLQTTKTSSDTPTFTGASDFDDAVSLVQGSDYTDVLHTFVRQIGTAYFLDCPFRIGDNSTSTQFNDNGVTVVSPASNDANDPRYRLTTQAMRTYLNLRNNAADTATFSGTWLWGTRAPFDWDQDDAAVVTFNSPTFAGMGDFTVGSSITGDATWDDAGVVIMADTGVDLDGSTFKNPFGTHSVQLGGAMDIADMRFESYASKHAIEIDTAGTYNFSNVFFDQSGTNDVENTSGGAVTINISNGGTTPTVTNTGGGSTTTVNAFVTLTVTTQDAKAVAIPYAKVRIENASTGALISEGVANNLGVFSDSNYNYGGNLGVVVKVRKNSPGEVRYLPINQPATITATGLTVTVSMAQDTIAGDVPMLGIMRQGITSEDESGNAVITAEIDVPDSGASRKLVVGAFYWDSSTNLTMSAATYDGNAMTSISGIAEQEGAGNFHEIFLYRYDIPDADSGRKTISITFSANVAIKAIGFAIIDDVATGAEDNFGTHSGDQSATNPSIGINNSVSAWEVGFVMVDDLDSPSATDEAVIRRSDLSVDGLKSLAVLTVNRLTTGVHNFGANYGGNTKTWVAAGAAFAKN